MSHIVIVGGGVWRRARRSRRCARSGYNGDVTVVAAEQHTALSVCVRRCRRAISRVRRGRMPASCTRREWYGEHGVIELRLGTGVDATALDRARTGSRSNDGSALVRPGAARDRIRPAKAAASRAPSWTGCARCARSTTRSGCSGTCGTAGAGRADRIRLDRHGGRRDGAHARQRGDGARARRHPARGRRSAPELGAVFARLHKEKGVDLRPSVQRRAHRGPGPASRGAGRRRDGARRPRRSVGVGAVPNTSLAAEAGHRRRQRRAVDRCVAARRALPTCTRRATSRTRTTRSIQRAPAQRALGRTRSRPAAGRGAGR